MAIMRIQPATRAWLGRLALSLALGVCAGALAFLVARAITSVKLFAQQQQFIQEVTRALQGGVEGLANSNLRAVRLRVQQIDAEYQQVSMLIGFVTSAAAAGLAYLWLERRATPGRSPPRLPHRIERMDKP